MWAIEADRITRDYHFLKIRFIFSPQIQAGRDCLDSLYCLMSKCDYMTVSDLNIYSNLQRIETDKQPKN